MNILRAAAAAAAESTHTQDTVGAGSGGRESAQQEPCG